MLTAKEKKKGKKPPAIFEGKKRGARMPVTPKKGRLPYL